MRDDVGFLFFYKVKCIFRRKINFASVIKIHSFSLIKGWDVWADFISKSMKKNCFFFILFFVIAKMGFVRGYSHIEFPNFFVASVFGDTKFLDRLPLQKLKYYWGAVPNSKIHSFCGYLLKKKTPVKSFFKDNFFFSSK